MSERRRHTSHVCGPASEEAEASWPWLHALTLSPSLTNGRALFKLPIPERVSGWMLRFYPILDQPPRVLLSIHLQHLTAAIWHDAPTLAQAWQWQR